MPIKRQCDANRYGRNDQQSPEDARELDAVLDSNCIASQRLNALGFRRVHGKSFLASAPARFPDR